MSDRQGGETLDPISCAEAVEKVYEYLDGELDAGWTERVHRHIEVCRRCYPYFNFERIFLDHVRSLRLPDEHSERLERSVHRALGLGD
ncbi:MAG: zf-HC2 domain-containing protein [Gemmatimonadota bacterium]|nr:zf-HC2 domain-containing protein [Gemmatimonadota bacterium]